MEIFLKIALYASSVMVGLATLAFGMVMLGKFLRDNTYDPEADAGH